MKDVKKVRDHRYFSVRDADVACACERYCYPMNCGIH